LFGNIKTNLNIKTEIHLENMGVAYGINPTWAAQTNEGRTHIATKGIVQSGLVLNLDAGVSSSYLGSGTTWTDLSGQGNTGTLTNGPTYSSANGGGLVFDGSDDYVELNTTNIVTGTNPFTFDCFYTITSTNNGGVLFGNFGPGYITNYLWISGEYGIYINSDVYFPGYPLQPGTYHMAATRESNGSVVLYKNGVEVNSGSLTASIPDGPNFRIGSDTNSAGGPGGEELNGKIYSMKLYNRVLTAAEVKQNFNALRGRFSI
jgi:hypothetical protein